MPNTEISRLNNTTIRVRISTTNNDYPVANTAYIRSKNNILIVQKSPYRLLHTIPRADITIPSFTTFANLEKRLQDLGLLSITPENPSMFIPAGGTTGQVLRKKSNVDYDVEWVTP
jgi:hypothetical protein